MLLGSVPLSSVWYRYLPQTASSPHTHMHPTHTIIVAPTPIPAMPWSLPALIHRHPTVHAWGHTRSTSSTHACVAHVHSMHGALTIE